MNFHDLFLRVRALVAPRRLERELDEEIAFHIERDVQKHLAAGMSPADARARALARFGSVPLVADECRDVRGTALIDDLLRDIKYAFRSFRRAPLAAVTIVMTVGVGLGLVGAVFAFYSWIFLRVDAVRNPDELFGVWRGPRGEAGFTRLDYEAMRRETSVFTDSAAMLSPRPSRIEGRQGTATLVTGNFFQVLGVQAALGRTLTPADDEPSAARPVIVLSHRAWQRLFAGDLAAIGRGVRIGALPYDMVGVMPEDFRGLAGFGEFPVDYWAPLGVAGQFHNAYAGGGDEIPVEIVGRLKPGFSPETAAAGLTVWASGRSFAESSGGGAAASGPAAIRLRPRAGTQPVDVTWLMVFAPFFFAFGLILAIGCANVANLLLARGISRQREIGIRLALGASRLRIVRQLLTENLLLALAAGAIGVAVTRLFLVAVLQAGSTTAPMEILQMIFASFAPVADSDWRVVVFLLAGAVVSTALFGLAPALHATRLELVRTMRGELTSDARPGRARHALIGLQVGASALLLICAAVFLRGALTAATVEPGLRTIDTLRLSVEDPARRGAMFQAATADPSVAVAAAASLPMRGVAEVSTLAGATADRSLSAQATADTETSASRVPVGVVAVSPEYFGVLGIDIVSGRGFTQAERAPEAGVVVVHETLARQLWPNRSALGQVMRLDARSSASPGRPSLPSGALTVVGVARDVQGGNNGAYLPTSPESPGIWLFARVHGDPDQVRLALLERLSWVDPGLEILTLRSMARTQTYLLGFAFWVAVFLGGLGLLLTVTGLFSVLSYIVEQQAKEIGVRMALGATTKNVVGLVLSQSLRPVGIGLAAGGGLAAALAIVLMATGAASEIGDSVRVFDPLAYAASLLIIVTACFLAMAVPALRAARIDPIETLRND
jgi:predicted permease